MNLQGTILMKLPPYGKPLRDLLQSGQLPSNDVYIYIGDKAWDKGKMSSYSRPSRTLILPPNQSPLAYEWPVSSCDILLIETSQLDTEYIENFVQILFDHNANKVILISTNMLTTIYKKDF